MSQPSSPPPSTSDPEDPSPQTLRQMRIFYLIVGAFLSINAIIVGGVFIPADYSLTSEILIHASPQDINQKLQKNPWLIPLASENTSPAIKTITFTPQKNATFQVTPSPEHLPHTVEINYSTASNGQTSVTYSITGKNHTPIFGGYIAAFTPSKWKKHCDRALQKIKHELESP